MKTNAAIKTKGFTLVEILITMGITLLLGLVILQIYITTLKSSKSLHSNIDAQQAAKLAILKLEPFLQQAVPPSSAYEHDAISSPKIGEEPKNIITFWQPFGNINGTAPLLDKDKIMFNWTQPCYIKAKLEFKHNSITSPTKSFLTYSFVDANNDDVPDDIFPPNCNGSYSLSALASKNISVGEWNLTHQDPPKSYGLWDISFARIAPNQTSVIIIYLRPQGKNNGTPIEVKVSKIITLPPK